MSSSDRAFLFLLLASAFSHLCFMGNSHIPCTGSQETSLESFVPTCVRPGQNNFRPMQDGGSSNFKGFRVYFGVI